MEKEGEYIYCIIESNQPRSFGPLGIGARGDELYTICFNDIAAVVSNSPIIKYRVSRENTIAHEKAIEEVMKEYTVLPVRFVTIAEDEEKVKKILEIEHDRFIDLLKNIEGKKELGLKAIFIEDVIYKEILEKHQGIRALKEKIADLSPEKTYYQRMEIGKLVEQVLGEEKEICKKDILDTLSALAVDVKINNTYGELMIINAAFLIEKHKESEFDRKVGELGEKYNNKIKFKYVGTVPPFNFVNLIIETGK
ncbi:MAG: gas vesicle synthesis GvpLGvpF [Nitrospinae bacterium RIFCSPLOWO2_02_FULL_39_110]|nr:MAG: gas vesicle synthesis GvpLGvpF [Nitrospinae bacterium RIFCSPHIGHO2_02_39_11]OGV98337.1 MAG: gas vesicle synthesis GvpLGvpF [Nitrospinae bacterium RIFCSPHIGHO2_12_FULL_39_42]OGW05135.1 MAG: gas vesicle synthesis GvpLGvpF [Nitrospinae bacterium RIFCSPLOWO2_02_39_17]OGW06900.1 MAG: gas vesicle synthesis GvpLGvpF [Nitrospinae bacterium RIFCSPLOWO2_02_FULL_39_110]OGW07555.1 MAG: gas vesicle synthesis GvpLGvpF [Nitrospinae bacterium RIFCSPLOWO2_12_39_15]